MDTFDDIKERAWREYINEHPDVPVEWLHNHRTEIEKTLIFAAKTRDIALLDLWHAINRELLTREILDWLNKHLPAWVYRMLPWPFPLIPSLAAMVAAHLLLLLVLAFLE